MKEKTRYFVSKKPPFKYLYEHTEQIKNLHIFTHANSPNVVQRRQLLCFCIKKNTGQPGIKEKSIINFTSPATFWRQKCNNLILSISRHLAFCMARVCCSKKVATFRRQHFLWLSFSLSPVAVFRESKARRKVSAKNIYSCVLQDGKLPVCGNATLSRAQSQLLCWNY